MPLDQSKSLAAPQVDVLRPITVRCPSQHDLAIDIQRIAPDTKGPLVPAVAGLGRHKSETKNRFLSDDLIIMLAGFGILLAGSGLVPYLLALL